MFLTDDIESKAFSAALVQRSIGSAHTVPLQYRSWFPCLPGAVQSIVAVSLPLVIGHMVSTAQNGSPAKETFYLKYRLSVNYSFTNANDF